MKVMVAVKRVIDSNVKVRVRTDGSGVDDTNVKMSLNPFDEIAVEEAVRLKERGQASEVLVVSCGPDACQDVLRTALAMGADRAVHLRCDGALQPLAVARLLAWLAAREQSQLCLLGKQAIDDDCNQTGQMLAALARLPQATFASRIEREGEQRLRVEREVDGGQESLGLPLPAVVTVDLRLNEPRYVTLPNIMKARKKPLEVVDVAQTGVDVAPRLRVLKVAEPPQRQAGVRVQDVAELARRLRDEARVI